jgi:TrmH family RNA methyltransferase
VILTDRSARIRAARQLAHAKHRRASGDFLAEGPQAVGEAIASGMAVEVFVADESATRRRGEIEQAEAAGVPVHIVDGRGFAGLVASQTPQGVVARCRWVPATMAQVLAAPGAGQLVLAHEMADPGNAGALIRVADAAGGRAVALSRGSVDPTNPKCVRATAGSLFHVPVVDAGRTTDAIEALRRAGYRTVAADIRTDAVDLFAAERSGLLAGRVAWMLGNEAHGLPDEFLSEADNVVRIPILGRAESLNLATAAAVCLYAYARLAAGSGSG